MLRTISSSAFTGSIIALTGAYYLVILLIYFRKDLRNLGRHLKKKDGPNG